MEKNGTILDDYDPNHILTQYFRNEIATQNNETENQMNKRTYRKKNNKDDGSSWNQLYSCPDCGRVWSRWYSGIEKYLRFLDKDFPKQEKVFVCPECKPDGLKYDKVEYE